ncbi:RNA-binding protein NOB1 [Anopheles funestus]|uniref:RNA-binding protein NOB1 n=1 Tax=Anopheles funestus TaxID=62324 RepID=UPI0020C67CF3|nr:RNA-binding protein NOB1 [Anopheles funestus]
MPKFQHLVVDTAAFVKNVQLQYYAEDCYTTPGVMAEIRNNRQLKRLAVLPYNLQVKSPDPDVLAKVVAIAKKTGDYASLSLVDLQVIALTYELETIHVGRDHLRDEPKPAIMVTADRKPAALRGTELLKGFYIPSRKANKDDKELQQDSSVSKTPDQPEREEQEQPDPVSDSVTDEQNEPEEQEQPDPVSDLVTDEQKETAIDSANEEEDPDNEICEEEDDLEDVDEDEDDDGDDDDGQGWITPSNIKQVKRDMGTDVHEEAATTVACITTDYALQNVLKQIGLKVAALDGRIIKQVRTYILRCYSCFKTTPDATKVFCPKCGNNTLKKVAVSLDAEGKQIIHINTRRPLTAKYKNRPVAKFTGGKYATNPLLFEDQPLPQQRISVKARSKTNALGDDYTSGYSPFVMRDVDSRSAVLRGSSNLKQRMTNYTYDNKRRGYNK